MLQMCTFEFSVGEMVAFAIVPTVTFPNGISIERSIEDRRAFFNELFGRLTQEPVVELAQLDDHPTKPEYKVASFAWSSAADDLFVTEAMIFRERDAWQIDYHGIFVDSASAGGSRPYDYCKCGDGCTGGGGQWPTTVCAGETVVSQYSASANLRFYNAEGEGGLLAAGQLGGFYATGSGSGLSGEFPQLELRRAMTWAGNVVVAGGGQIQVAAGPVTDAYPEVSRRFFTAIMYDQRDDGSYEIAFQFLATWPWSSSNAALVM